MYATNGRGRKRKVPPIPLEEGVVERDTDAVNQLSSSDGTGDEGSCDQTNKEGVDVNFVFSTGQDPSNSQSQSESLLFSSRKRTRPDDFDDISEDAQLEETNNNY